MANRNAVFGARLVGHMYGTLFNARVRPYVVLATDDTALYVGDFVKLTGTGGTSTSTLPRITQAAEGNVLLGVVVGFSPDPAYLNQVYRTASTERICYVCDDPFAVFEIQTNGTSRESDFGANADFIRGTPSNIFGTSGTQLNQVTLDPDEGQLRILRLFSRVDNEIGEYAKIEVMINEHIFKQTAGI